MYVFTGKCIRCLLTNGKHCKYAGWAGAGKGGKSGNGEGEKTVNKKEPTSVSSFFESM
jgi:hypothetical protein